MDRILLFFLRLFFSAILLVLGLGGGIALLIPTICLYVVGAFFTTVCVMIRPFLVFLCGSMMVYLTYLFFGKHAMDLVSYLWAMFGYGIIGIASSACIYVGAFVLAMCEKIKCIALNLMILFAAPWAAKVG